MNLNPSFSIFFDNFPFPDHPDINRPFSDESEEFED